jgi:transposase-like protein
MVFLFGNKDYYDLLGYITMYCPACTSRRIFSVKQERKKLTLYFVPTFQYSSRQIITCEHCRETFQVEDELKPKIIENMISSEKLEKMKKAGKVDYLLGEAPRKKRRNVTKIYCQSCNAGIKKGMLYCPQCGNKL